MNVTLLGAGVLIVYLLIGTVVTGGLQLYLAGRKNRGWGLIIPTLSLVFTLFIGGTMAFAYMEVTPWDNSTGYDSDEVSIRLNYIYDDDGSVAAFSDLKVTDRTNGEKYAFPLEFDEDGNLIGSEEALKYKEKVQLITRDDVFSGKSVAKKDLRRIYMKHHVKEYAPMFYYMLISLIPFAVHTVIYVVMRKRLKLQADAQEIKKMRISDL